MTENLSLPELPTSSMFIGLNNPMTIEWQEFFRTLFKRVGGISGPSITNTSITAVAELFSTPVNYGKRITELEKKLLTISEPKNYDKKINEFEKRLFINSEVNIIKPIPADYIELEEIGAATYDDIQDWINNTQSAGYVSGGLITATLPADGTIAISAVKGFIKTTDSEIGVTQSFDLDGTTAFALTNNNTNYIYVDFVLGPRFQVTTDRTTIEHNRQFTLGRVYREGNVTHIIQSGVQLPNFLRKAHRRLIEVRGFERASGGVISETGNRYLESTDGVFYLGHNRITTTGVDTSGAPTFTRHYHNAGVWDSDEKSQIAEGGAGFYKYDDGTNLVNLSNNKYGVFWVFIHFDNDLHVVVGRGDYTLAEAQAVTIPPLPNIVSDFSTLAAKIIIEEDAINFKTIESAYEILFSPSGAFEHNDLGAIQGGGVGEYYHLTAAQLAALHARYTDAEARAAINNIFGADGKADLDINLDTHKLTNVVDPIANQDADTKKGRDDALTIHAGLATVHQNAPALIATHAAIAGAHHVKYTDVNARTAIYGALPAFHAYVNAAQNLVTGDGTAYSITGAIWTEFADNLGNFVNGTFTAPIDGLYLISTVLWITGVGVAHTTGQFEIVTSNRTYTVSYQNYANIQSGGNIYIPISLIVDMDNADTCFLRLTVFSGAKVINVIAPTYFSGALVQR